jgi:D-3-phosphoglycerate dehydrogenase
MIDKAQFDKMKTGVRIINCARGGIMNEAALYEALTSGKVAGAALDVYDEEPPMDWKLAKLDNVICSPHIGAATKEAQGRVGAEVADKLIEFAKSM